MDDDAYTLRPIGFVRSPLRDRRDAPRQAHEGAPEALLELAPEFAPALHRVRPEQDLILLTWLHLADRSVLQTHPRDDLSVPLTGVFATRSSDRPNPIGLHRVEVVAIEGATMTVRDLEAVDGTPVLDVKPVLGSAVGER